MTRPLCRCGCGRQVKRLDHTWATPSCVPRELRADGWRKARRVSAYRYRAIKFREEIKRLTANGRTITTESILESFARIERWAYQNGYQAFDRRKGWSTRPKDIRCERTEAA